jgi:predicted ester cyclase
MRSARGRRDAVSIEEDGVISGRREILETAYAALSRGDLRGFCALFDPQVVTVSPALGNPVGWTAVLAAHQAFLAGFPDMCFELEEVIEEGSRTACRLTATGTHTRAFAGWSPTGRLVHLAICAVHEWYGPRVVTTQSYWDQLVLLHQLGVVAPVTSAAPRSQSDVALHSGAGIDGVELHRTVDAAISKG